MTQADSITQENSSEPTELPKFGTERADADMESWDQRDQMVAALGKILAEKGITDTSRLVFSGFSASENDSDPLHKDVIFAAQIEGIDGQRAEAEDPLSYAVEAWEAEEVPAVAVYDTEQLNEIHPMAYKAETNMGAALVGIVYFNE